MEDYKKLVTELIEDHISDQYGVIYEMAEAEGVEL